MTDIRLTRYDHPDAMTLIEEVQQEYVIRYGGPDETPVDPAQFAEPRGLFVLLYADGVPLAMGGWRRVPDSRTAELKRMYVRRDDRGRGYARAVLGHLELAAERAGIDQLILETGTRQPEAIALYESTGYRPITPFGHYADAELSIHLGKSLRAPDSA
jgi:GNAT superfamily N-acetyltransferase